MNDKSFRIDWYAHKAFIDFGTLEVNEIGVFAQIINLIYIKNGPIDYDCKYIGKHCNIGAARCQKIIIILLDKEKIFLTEDGKISQEKCEKELKTTQNRREKASENGQKGAETRWGNEQNQDDANGNPIIPAIASTRTSTSKVKKEPPLPPDSPKLPNRGTGFSNSSGSGGQGNDTSTGAKPFRVEIYLTDADEDAFRKVANGWSLDFMIAKYNSYVNSGKQEIPRYPAKAFLGWVPKFHKGKSP